MRPSGLAAVSKAKADGTWNSPYEGQAKMEVPADFASALAAAPTAKAMFVRLNAAKPVLDPVSDHDGKARRHPAAPNRAVRCDARSWGDDPPAAAGAWLMGSSLCSSWG